MKRLAAESIARPIETLILFVAIGILGYAVAALAHQVIGALS